MSHRLSRLVGLPAVLTYVVFTGCVSVGSQPPSYVEDPKAKAQDPCQAQAQAQAQKPQDKSANDPCKKPKP